MKVDRIINRAKRWRVHAWGWPLVCGMPLLVLGLGDTFTELKPAFLLPWYFWLLLMGLAGWGFFESHRKADVAHKWNVWRTVVGLLVLPLLISVTLYFLHFVGFYDEIHQTWFIIQAAITVAVAVSFRRLWLTLPVVAVLIVYEGFWITHDWRHPFYDGYFPFLGLGLLAQFFSALAAHYLIGLSTRWRRGTTIDCQSCGYDLRMLSSTTCPECGQPFIAVGSTHAPAVRPRRQWLSAETRVGVVLLALILFYVFGHPAIAWQHYLANGRADAQADWSACKAMHESGFIREIGEERKKYDLKTGLRAHYWNDVPDPMSEIGRLEGYWLGITEIIEQRRTKWTKWPAVSPALVSSDKICFKPAAPGETLADHLFITPTSDLRFRGGTIEHIGVRYAALPDGTGRVLVLMSEVAAVFSPEGDWLEAFEWNQGDWGRAKRLDERMEITHGR